MSLENPWSQLVSIGSGSEDEVIPIAGDTLSIGRKRESDLVISDNKHVSGCHCILSRSADSNSPTIKDTSSNGTLLNHKRLKKNVEVELSHNDVITLVKKESPNLNVVFRFETLSSNDDATLLYDTLPLSQQEEEEEEEEEGDEELSVCGGSGRKRQHSDGEGDEEGAPSAKVSAMVAEELKPALRKIGSMEETLVCSICQEILHDCVSLQPCMHTYCAGCYSQWMSTSSSCPSCRKKVDRINKNHMVNNLVGAFLRANPDKARSADDLRDLDANNKITHDMLYPKSERDRGSDDDYYSSSTSDTDDDDDTPGYIMPPVPFISPILALCRQCPNAISTHSHPTPHPTPHPFTCNSSTQHVICQCCLRPMPNRESADMPQKCELCQQFFCSMYWPCSNQACSGCLAKFKEMNFLPTCLNGILGNAYESTILKDYLEGKAFAIKDLLLQCCGKLESGEFASPDPRLTPATITCQKCAQKCLKGLAYQYRREIPRSQLPAEVGRRVDCYWGKECRTQFTKPEHARKFNHVCEKTRQS